MTAWWRVCEMSTLSNLSISYIKTERKWKSETRIKKLIISSFLFTGNKSTAKFRFGTKKKKILHILQLTRKIFFRINLKSKTKNKYCLLKARSFQLHLYSFARSNKAITTNFSYLSFCCSYRINLFLQ